MSVFLFDSAFERLKTKCIGSPFEGLGDIHAAALSLSCSRSCDHTSNKDNHKDKDCTAKGEDGARGTYMYMYPYGCSIDEETEVGGFGCNVTPVSLPALPMLRSGEVHSQIPIGGTTENLFAAAAAADDDDDAPAPPHPCIASDSSLVVWCLSLSSSPPGTPISSPPHPRQTSMFLAARETSRVVKTNNCVEKEMKHTQAKCHADDFDGVGGLGN